MRRFTMIALLTLLSLFVAGCGKPEIESGHGQVEKCWEIKSAGKSLDGTICRVYIEGGLTCYVLGKGDVDRWSIDGCREEDNA